MLRVASQHIQQVLPAGACECLLHPVPVGVPDALRELGGGEQRFVRQEELDVLRDLKGPGPD